MATHNDITGDALVSKRSNENYRSNYDRIFGKKKEKRNAGARTNDAVVPLESVSGTGCAGEAYGAGADYTEESGSES